MSALETVSSQVRCILCGQVVMRSTATWSDHYHGWVEADCVPPTSRLEAPRWSGSFSVGDRLR